MFRSTLLGNVHEILQELFDFLHIQVFEIGPSSFQGPQHMLVDGTQYVPRFPGLDVAPPRRVGIDKPMLEPFGKTAVH